MNEPKEEPLKLIELQPREVDFTCYGCGASCKLFPRSLPMAAVHAEEVAGKKLPRCEAWEWSRKEKKLAAFLKRCGLPVGYEEEPTT